jgi:hypothetical protein
LLKQGRSLPRQALAAVKPAGALCLCGRRSRGAQEDVIGRQENEGLCLANEAAAMTAPGSAPLTLRAHHLLCVHGFRGLGYSEAFVARMRQIKNALERDSIAVAIGLGPDVICAACPHVGRHVACSRESGTDRDRAVIAILGIESGTVWPWRDWQERIAERVSPTMLAEICQDCSWFPLGYCTLGIMGLRQASLEGECR